MGEPATEEESLIVKAVIQRAWHERVEAIREAIDLLNHCDTIEQARILLNEYLAVCEDIENNNKNENLPS
jgi:geranylgeranyl pyrophosphate synthase